MDPSTFLTALLAIIVIDLVLAGDNAIVIALAARGLPAHLQKRAILWGAFGAIAVRSLMTLVVVWLLKIPGLLLVGGALLVWIAYKLLLPEDDGGEAHGPVATTFWGAMRTIVIADAVMGLDNVLAVAGASHGNYLLVVLGLLISVPIVVWGSAIVLKVVERVPSVVYLGAGVLVLTAAKMMSSEPLLAPAFEAVPLAKVADVPDDPARALGRLREKPSALRVAHPRAAGRIRQAAPARRELGTRFQRSTRRSH